jgi:hypothetical protein
MRKFIFSVCAIALLGFSVSEANAQVSFGAHASWASEVDLGLGARASIALPVENLSIVPTFDFFFPSTGVSEVSMKWMELNANAHYAFPLADNPGILPYAGGGINFVRLSSTVDMGPLFGGKQSVSDTEAGLNLLGGVKFPSFGKLIPFGELRYATVGKGQIILTGGVNF